MTSYCVFDVGDRRVGVSMAYVREIIDPTEIQPIPVPLAPKFFRGLFNLRGQVIPCLELTTFVGATEAHRRPSDRAIVVEKGNFRFAAPGERLDTVEIDESTLLPLADNALNPSLDAEAVTERGPFQVIHLDRLEACVSRALKFHELSENPVIATATAA